MPSVEGEISFAISGGLNIAQRRVFILIWYHLQNEHGADTSLAAIDRELEA
jgi:hypothetical protein